MAEKNTELPLDTKSEEKKEEKKAELVQVDQTLPASSFANKESFAHVQRVAMVFSQSELVPAKYKGNPANCVIALEMAARMNVSPLMVMQNLDVILGRPCWSSQFLIASLNACGRFSPLRYEEDAEEGGRTRAMAIDKKTNDKLYGVWVTMEMAKAEGWVAKSGSKWKTMPELMRRYRAASFFTKQYAPEISMGFQTVEEVIDITPTQEIEPDWEALQNLFDVKKEALKAVSPAKLAAAERILNEKEKVSYKRLFDELKAL